MSEHDNQVAVFDVLRLNERRYPFLRWVHAIPNGGARHPVVAGKLKAEGVKSGIADIFLPIPMKGKHGMYIEMKYGKNKMSDNQTDFMVFAIDQDYHFYAAWNAAVALAEIERYLEIQLTR